MLVKQKFNSKNFVSLMLLLCLVSVSTAYAQEKRMPGSNLLIPEDKEMVEMQRRNAQLTAVQRQSLEQSINELVKSMNGTWELVDRMVSNKETGGKMISVPTKGTMTFNLQASGTSAAGDFVVTEEGLGSSVISEGVGDGEAFVLGSYNLVNFESGFEGGALPGTGVNKLAQQQASIVISEQIAGELLGSYEPFRQLTFFKETSKDITQYKAVKSDKAGINFVGKTAFRSLSSVDKDNAVDPFDIIKLNGDVMILGISSKGLVDVWRKISPSVQMEGKSLKAYWESAKASKRLLNPTFRRSQ